MRKVIVEISCSVNMKKVEEIIRENGTITETEILSLLDIRIS